MYFNAKRADWLRENGYCPEVDSFKEAQRVFGWVMSDIYEAAIGGAIETTVTYCPDKYSIEIEDTLKDLGYEVEYVGGTEVLKVQW